jgi:hypothetical protein
VNCAAGIARRGCGEQALAFPGIAISADVDIHLFVILACRVDDLAPVAPLVRGHFLGQPVQINTRDARA